MELSLWGGEKVENISAAGPLANHVPPPLFLLVYSFGDFLFFSLILNNNFERFFQLPLVLLTEMVFFFSSFWTGLPIP